MVPWSNILNTEKSYNFKAINVRKFVDGSLRLVWWDPINWKSTDSKKIKIKNAHFSTILFFAFNVKIKNFALAIIVHYYYYYPIYKNEILERYCHKTT